MFKIVIAGATILCAIIGFIIGAEFGLMALVGMNLCFVAFMQYDKREVIRAKIEVKTQKIVVDTRPLVNNVLAAACEIMRDHDHMPLWKEMGKVIVIGFGTEHRVFIPLFEVRKNNVVSLTSQIDNDIPDEAIMPLSKQRVLKLPEYEERQQYEIQNSNRSKHQGFSNLR